MVKNGALSQLQNPFAHAAPARGDGLEKRKVDRGEEGEGGEELGSSEWNGRFTGSDFSSGLSLGEIIVCKVLDRSPLGQARSPVLV